MAAQYKSGYTSTMDQGDVASHYASEGAPHGALVTSLVVQPAHLALSIRLLYQVSAAGST